MVVAFKIIKVESLKKISIWSMSLVW